MRKPIAYLPMTLLVVLIASGLANAEDLLHIEVVGLHNNTGQLGCSIFSSATGFPTDQSAALHRTMTPIKDHKATCDFAGLPVGRYAVAVMHDENSNGRLETNFIGIPKEGVGASNDAKATMGPPKFDDASFEYGGGRKDLTIHVDYLFSPL